MNLHNELSELIDPKKNKLGGVIGLTETTIKVEGRPGFVWVRLLDNFNEVIQAHNRKVSPTYDMPVILSFDGLKYSIEDVDVNRYANWNTSAAFLPDHGSQHSAMQSGGGGGDIVWVDQRQFLPLLPMPAGVTGSSTINVAPYVFRNSYGDFIYTGNTGVFIPPSPSISGSIVQLVMMKDMDGTFYTVPGTPFFTAVSGTYDFVSHIPKTIPNNNDIPLVAVGVTSSVSGTPFSWDNMVDVRQFYKGYISAPTGSGYIETIDMYNSGTFVGPFNELNLVDYTVSVSGSRATVTNSLPIHGTVHISGGSDVIPNSIPSGTSGLLSGADKFKLDNLSYLRIREVDGTPNVVNVHTIVVTNGTLTDDTGGQVTINTGGSGGIGYFLITEDLSSQITGATAHFDTTLTMMSMPLVTCNLRQLPSAVTPDEDMGGFTLSFTPTVSDSLVVDYYQLEANIIHDDNGAIVFDDLNNYLLEA